MTPFNSWNGREDLDSFKYLKLLEDYFGEHACVVNSKQMAVQLCLELMGSRSNLVPVVMPVTSSIEVFTGAVYAGALPIVLDVDTSTLQVKLDDLQELQEDHESVVVVLDRAGAYPTPRHVVEAVLDLPTIAVVRHPPHDQTDQLHLEATFTVYDLSEVIGTGAVIFHSNTALLDLLKALRGGPLGHRAQLSEDSCLLANHRFREELDLRERMYHSVHAAFDWELNQSGRDDILLWEAADLPGPLYFHVPDAARMVEYLRIHDIPCRRAFYPLHKVPEVARRLPRHEEADYTGAELLFKHTIMLPSHAGIEMMVPAIVEKMYDCGRSSSRDDQQG